MKAHERTAVWLTLAVLCLKVESRLVLPAILLAVINGLRWWKESATS